MTRRLRTLVRRGVLVIAVVVGAAAPAAARAEAPPATPGTLPPDQTLPSTAPPITMPAAPTLPGGFPSTLPPPTAPRSGEEVVPDTVALPPLPPIDDPDAVSAPLIPVPTGCPLPAREQAVFVGTLVTRDAVTARFVVGRVRSGTVEGFAVDGLIDIRYGDDVRFLEQGRSYLVGAGIDDASGVLVSTVRPPAPGFGGSEVAAVDASDLDCPVMEDPVRTLLLDGTTVETGVLSGLRSAERDILRAILQPVAVALAVLAALAGLKLLLFATFRSSRDLGDRPPRERSAAHG